MKYLIKKIYFTFTFIILLPYSLCYSSDTQFRYTHSNIYNYFSGIISVTQDYPNKGYKYLNKVQSLKKVHDNYNVEFLQTLVMLEKFDEAFLFSKKIWKESEYIFEADLLLGIEYFINRDFKNAKKYFKRLNNISRNNLYFRNFFDNSLLSWVEAAKNKKNESFFYYDKIPERYYRLNLIQNSLLNCFFDTPKTEVLFKKLIDDKDVSFSRYKFFLGNYFLSKKEVKKAENLFRSTIDKNNTNLLLKQSNNFILNNKEQKILNLFSCKNVNDSVAEIFYIIANLYSTQKNYKLSNFYLKISLLLNPKFIPNKILLAENLYNQDKHASAQKIYKSIKAIGPIYSWFGSLTSAKILSNNNNKKSATKIIKKEFNLLSKPTFENYYQMANFFKDNEYHEEAIKYYSEALKIIKPNHFLIPKILDRRGTSYERIDEWEKGEKDLQESLKILPNQAYVLNYLAYTWIDKGINIEEALVMLEKALTLRENDGYIIDSFGWALYLNQNYKEAEKYMQRAVELMPRDPVVNDHYADVLWKLDKNIQARYFWSYVLTLEETKKELKDKISRKLIFGNKENLKSN